MEQRSCSPIAGIFGISSQPWPAPLCCNWYSGGVPWRWLQSFSLYKASTLPDNVTSHPITSPLPLYHPLTHSTVATLRDDYSLIQYICSLIHQNHLTPMYPLLPLWYTQTCMIESGNHISHQSCVLLSLHKHHEANEIILISPGSRCYSAWTLTSLLSQRFSHQIPLSDCCSLDILHPTPPRLLGLLDGGMWQALEEDKPAVPRPRPSQASISACPRPVTHSLSQASTEVRGRSRPSHLLCKTS